MVKCYRSIICQVKVIFKLNFSILATIYLQSKSILIITDRHITNSSDSAMTRVFNGDSSSCYSRFINIV